jgi:hypothetical protein
MSFTTSKLTGERVLVRGSDIFGTEGSTVLDSSQWVEMSSRKEFSQATEEFEKAVEEFFAPLTRAAEKASKKLEKPTDAISYVVLQEATEGVEAKPAQLVKLTHDSICLRLIEQGDTDRLIWVNDTLEVLAPEDVPVPVHMAPSAEDVLAMGVEATAPDDATGPGGVPLEEG